MSSYTAADPGDALQFLLGTGESDAIQIAAIDALGRYQNQAIPTTLISRWPELSHVVRGQIVTAFLSKTDRVGQSCSPGGRQDKAGGTVSDAGRFSARLP